MSAAFKIPLDPGLITVEEFEAMDLPDTCGWELIDGEVVSVTFPDLDHRDIQDHLVELLKSLFGDAAVVRMELPFAANHHNKNGADIGATTPARWRANRKRLDGAPELVIEVVSKSNRDRKLDRLQERCFEYGCQQFWRVYPKKLTVTVARNVGPGSTVADHYDINDLIPVNLFGVAGRIAVNDIFAGII